MTFWTPGCQAAAESRDLGSLSREFAATSISHPIVRWLIPVHLGTVLLEKHGFKAFISVERDQKRLFERLKQEHPSVDALGIACIPEPAMGMRLCIRTGIPPVGIPLNANRCARRMSQAQETSFNLEQLEELLLQAPPRTNRNTGSMRSRVMWRAWPHRLREPSRC